jgi:hypothetical protein
MRYLTKSKTVKIIESVEIRTCGECDNLYRNDETKYYWCTKIMKTVKPCELDNECALPEYREVPRRVLIN